ncbi:hypothetical protein V6617_02785 [Pelagibacterium nitratireducens]|uniref:Uncharacterized protein n=1 Tax=Pelagibacterium nitratireducens TaxID=1046114 RepID=A0ABZ2I2G7_9HYPH
MDTSKPEKRTISGHRLPVSLSVPRARPSLAGSAPQAAFLAQLIDSARASTPASPSRESRASQFYRAIETSDLKRLPMGYRKSVSA